VSTSPADVVASLEDQLHLEVEPLRVTLAMKDSEMPRPSQSTALRQ